MSLLSSPVPKLPNPNRVLKPNYYPGADTNITKFLSQSIRKANLNHTLDLTLLTPLCLSRGCYGKKFGAKGYGFAGGSGFLQTGDL